MKASAILSTITPPATGANVSRAERFALTGTSWRYDPRIHAARRDVADVALAGRLFAPHYARPLPLFCGDRPLPLLERPDGTQLSELLPGEAFAVLDIGTGWAWGYCAHDHHVGYVRIEGLVPASSVPNVRQDDAPVRAEDPAGVAEGFVGTPYLAGGRSAAGIDASALVQRALAPFGIAAPRDADLQRDSLGAPIALEDVRRNDLVFLSGQVGIMLDPDRLIHASADAGSVVIQPLATLRAAEEAGPSMLVKRLSL